MQSSALFPRWTTATIADAADTAPMELRELGLHISRCNGSRSRWFALRCSFDAVHDFVASRFVTTLFIVGGVIALTSVL